MKKIVFVSDESLVSGNIKCGIAEVVDSLALSLTQEYEVSVICLEGSLFYSKHITTFTELEKGIQFARIAKINYYILMKENWPNKIIEIIDSLQPDILHNFYEPSLISKLKVHPKVTVFSFDDISFLLDKMNWLDDYDFITTSSYNYRKYILQQSSIFSNKLKQSSFYPVTIGITTEIFTPTTGLFLPESYSFNNLKAKEINKKNMSQYINFSSEGPIFLTMGNISHIKGADLIIQSAKKIRDMGGILLIFGEADSYYEKKLKELFENDIIYYGKKVLPTRMIPILASADFYLQPSLMESGGLMPLTASQYGVIPIVTRNGGLADNFNESNAIIVQNDINTSIDQAFLLYNDKNKFIEKQKICMTQNFGWNTRKQNFINMYESKFQEEQ